MCSNVNFKVRNTVFDLQQAKGEDRIANRVLLNITEELTTQKKLTENMRKKKSTIDENNGENSRQQKKKKNGNT